ncbi:MAG: type II toxin-antitoxin system PemK/MazF family toxin [Lachnospiraceae bacterium]|nr:type II toxin-antitoxin system PemK/MazF family toxin [Lachnospiraceae bacterium]
MQIKRGDIFYADLTPVVGSEQGRIRPVLVIQNNTGNRYSPTVIVAAITSRNRKSAFPTHIHLEKGESGLQSDSFVLLEQVRTLDRMRLKDYIGQLDEKTMRQIDQAIVVSFGLEEYVEQQGLAAWSGGMDGE